MNVRLYSSREIILFFSFFANVFFLRPALYAEPRAYTFSTSVSAGFLYGQSEEIVYKNSAGDYLSQLLWDMKPLFYYGYALHFERSKPLQRAGFFTNLSVKYGAPSNTGVMEDRDWQDTRDHRLTHFSLHDNFTETMMLFDVKAGGSFPVFHRVVLKVYGLLSFMDFSWGSFNGYMQYASGSNGQYDEWSDSIRKTYFEGRIIGYDQTWIVFGAGFSLTLPVALPQGVLGVGLAFDISPFIRGVGVDNHWIRKMQFNDYLIGGVFLEPGLFVDFSFGRRIAFALSVSWRLLINAIGDTYIYSAFQDALYLDSISFNSGGAGLSVLDLGLSISIKL
ncbi:MAG: omptin family outer membrane protease [Treponema sp.]|jgi:outer membrane protease|nr:omptin family outer membrane protease [Treponema sp.]